MANQLSRDEARTMRKQGRSINEIVKLLSVSKSTISYWCRDIALTPHQQRLLVKRQRSAGLIGRLKAAEMKRDVRIRKTQRESKRGAMDVGSLSERDIFTIGLALYWGEGNKSGNEECGLTNSDPAIIRAFIAWMQRVYKIPPTDLILRISINETHKNRIAAVERYWSKVTSIPLSQFTKTCIIKTRSKKTYENPEQHFGTLRVKVRRGTDLHRRVMGSIQALRSHFME